MKATKLTIIVLAAATIVMGGCSNDSQILGPGADARSGSGFNQANRVATDSNESKPEPEYFVITAKVEMLDVENGCFYLQSDDGKTYTPVSPKDLVLESGLKLKAEGYVDEHINFFCGNGPAFVIENYENIDKPKMSDDNEYYNDSDIRTENAPSNEEFVSNEQTEERAPSKATEDRYMESEFMDRELEFKEKLKRDYNPSEPPNEEVPGMSDDDNDRKPVSSEDRPSYGEFMDRERELKEKYKRDYRPSDQPNDEAPRMSEDDNERELVLPEDRHLDDKPVDRELERKKKLEEEKRRRDQDNERP